MPAISLTAPSGRAASRYRRPGETSTIRTSSAPSPTALSSASPPLSSTERLGESFQAGSAGALEEDDVVVVAEERTQWREPKRE
jgi:hypothetical protein